MPLGLEGRVLLFLRRRASGGVLIAVIYVGGVGRMIPTFPVQGLDCVLVAEDLELDLAWCEVYPVESDCRRIVEAMG